MIDETARVIKANNIINIGLLGTKFTMEEKFYTQKLKNIYKLNVIIPIEKDRQYIHEAIYNQFSKNIFSDETKKEFLAIIKNLIERGSEGIILGCTEIPLLIKQEDVIKPLFDTLKIHIESAIDFCLVN